MHLWGFKRRPRFPEQYIPTEKPHLRFAEARPPGKRIHPPVLEMHLWGKSRGVAIGYRDPAARGCRYRKEQIALTAATGGALCFVV
jgi:hypothetical protein